MGPWNETLFAPPGTLSLSVPASTLRVQGAFRLVRAVATHSLSTLRPGCIRMNAKRTTALSLSVKVNVVPT
jgi:hypothetical protein